MFRFTVLLDWYPAQVAWARFSGSGRHASLCMLQQSLLTVYNIGGTLQHVALPRGVTGMHAVPGALLLKVGIDSLHVLRTQDAPVFLGQSITAGSALVSIAWAC